MGGKNIVHLPSDSIHFSGIVVLLNTEFLECYKLGSFNMLVTWVNGLPKGKIEKSSLSSYTAKACKSAQPMYIYKYTSI